MCARGQGREGKVCVCVCVCVVREGGGSHRHVRPSAFERRLREKVACVSMFWREGGRERGERERERERCLCVQEDLVQFRRAIDGERKRNRHTQADRRRQTRTDSKKENVLYTINETICAKKNR